MTASAVHAGGKVGMAQQALTEPEMHTLSAMYKPRPEFQPEEGCFFFCFLCVLNLYD